MADSGEAQKTDRVLRLSQADKMNKNLKGPFLIINWKGYTGETTVLGARTFGRAAKAQGIQEKPAYALLLASKTKPGDVIAVPGMSGSPDHLELDWVEGGSKIRSDMSGFMALKEIVIPANMKLYIPLYEDTDEEHGTVVGLNLQEMQFVKVQARAKKTEAAS